MYVNTEVIPQIDKIREFFLRGIAATFPLSTWPRIFRWMIVQRLIFKDDFNLGVMDDLIAAKLVRRAYADSRCGCSKLEIYELTENGHTALKDILK